MEHNSCDGGGNCNSMWKKKFAALNQEYQEFSSRVYDEVDLKFSLVEEKLSSYPELLQKVQSLETNYRNLSRTKQQLQTEHNALVGEYSDNRDKYDREMRKLLDEKRNLQENCSKLQEQIFAQETEINQLKFQLSSANGRMNILKNEVEKSVNTQLKIEEICRKFETEKEAEVERIKKESSDIHDNLNVFYGEKLKEVEVTLKALTLELIKSRKNNENLKQTIQEKDVLCQKEIDEILQKVSEWNKSSQESTLQMSIELEKAKEKLNLANSECAKKEESYNQLHLVAVNFLSSLSTIWKEIMDALGIDQDHLKSKDILQSLPEGDSSLIGYNRGDTDDNDDQSTHILLTFQKADANLLYYKSSILWWKNEMETKLSKLRKKYATSEKKFASKRLSLINEIGLTKQKLTTYREAIDYFKSRLEEQIVVERKPTPTSAPVTSIPIPTMSNKSVHSQTQEGDDFTHEFKYLLDQAELIVNALENIHK